MSETTGQGESAIAAVPSTPQEWHAFLAEYGKQYVTYRDGADELLDEDQVDALDRGEQVDVWLGAAPAPHEAVAAAEERLGLRFPPSLRGFFLASDGWEYLATWVDEVHPCDRVGWMRDGEDGGRVIEIYDSIPGNEAEVCLFRRSVEVAKGEDYWLLDPTDVGPDGEWAAYEFAPKYGDTTRHAGFSALFHSHYRSMAE